MISISIFFMITNFWLWFNTRIFLFMRLGHSMWVSWWTKRGLGRFFSGFLPFSPTTNFIPPFLHTHLIHFVSFHPPLWRCVRRGRPAPLLLTDLSIGASSHLMPRPDLVLDTSWGYLFFIHDFNKYLFNDKFLTVI